jgi:hypothetical protein
MMSKGSSDPVAGPRFNLQTIRMNNPVKAGSRQKNIRPPGSGILERSQVNGVLAKGKANPGGVPKAPSRTYQTGNGKLVRKLGFSYPSLSFEGRTFLRSKD